MDFTNRGAAHPNAQAHVAGGAAPSGGGEKRRGHWKEGPMWLRVTWIVLLFSATIVIAALATLLFLGSPKEADFVDKDKNQAVFLGNGQVYFGKIKSVTGKYIDLQNIYYLNVNQQPASQEGQQPRSNISLVKLGCELHGPADRMVINREQVTFWENLKDSGQVAKAIEKYINDNPGEQKCPTTAPAADTDSKP